MEPCTPTHTHRGEVHDDDANDDDEGEEESSYTPLSMRALHAADELRSPATPRARVAGAADDYQSPGGAAEYTPLVEIVVAVRVISFEEAAEFDAFCLQVVLEGHAPYEISRRYSHFDSLRSLLIARGHARVPRLPVKSLFGRRVRGAGALRDRSLALDEWLRALVELRSASASQDFLLFLVPGSGLEDAAGYGGAASVAQLATRPKLTWLQQALETRFDARVGLSLIHI